jgi:hypothetical protein
MIRFLAGISVALALVGCAPEERAAPVPVVPATTGAGQFGLTERAYVELEIATDDQALKLLDLGTSHLSGPLRELATGIGSAHRAELAALHGLLDAAGVRYVNNHEGHDMPGMPTPDELTALAQSGASFGTVFARLLKAHLDESAGVARTAAQSMAHPATRALATRMEQDRLRFSRRLGELVQV